MQHRKIFTMIIAGSIMLVAVIGVWLAKAPPVNAQCGSQASSCKNCHEVQGKLPVNNDGTAWHTSHAFGDFCYICHAGNNQAKDETEAHTGMVAPLSDVKASCMQCHPSDLDARAQVYATALGVEVGSGAPPAAGGTSEISSEVASAPVVASVPATSELAVDDPNLVNFTQRYDEIVLGKKPFNLGNAILIGLIGLVTVAGGGFVIIHEKLVNVSFGDTRKADGVYPADVVDILPTLTDLKPASRKSLQKVLENPKKAEKLLNLMDAVVSDETSEA
jgi:hypothetical protein